MKFYLTLLALTICIYTFSQNKLRDTEDTAPQIGAIYYASILFDDLLK